MATVDTVYYLPIGRLVAQVLVVLVKRSVTACRCSVFIT